MKHDYEHYLMRAIWRRKLRRMVILLVLGVAAVEVYGLPHLRFHTGPTTNRTARYWSPLGWRPEAYASFGRPRLVKLYPVEPSLLERGKAWVTARTVLAGDGGQ